MKVFDIIERIKRLKYKWTRHIAKALFCRDWHTLNMQNNLLLQKILFVSLKETMYVPKNQKESKRKYVPDPKRDVINFSEKKFMLIFLIDT